MRSVNKVILVGNIGKDPEMQYFEGNIAVARISLATNETYKDKLGNQQIQTEWHKIVLWRSLAELAQKLLVKGALIYVEGKLKTRTKVDKDGNKKYETEIVGDHFIVLDKKNDNDIGSSPNQNKIDTNKDDIDSGNEIIQGLPF
jgi:single-strand DNA-binding protein